MKNFILKFKFQIIILLIAFGAFAYNSYAADITPNFPVSLNDFSEGDVIEEEDWNAIENTIGETATTSKDTLHGKWNDLFASSTLPQITTLSNLTTVGTIGTGVWQATDVGVEYGGTGVSTLADHGVLLGSGTGAITVLAPGGNGTLLIGEAGSDPSMANITETGDAITISNGAASIDFAVHANVEQIADGIITTNLVNTTNPWADNEVSNTLTVDDYMQDTDINTLAKLNAWLPGESVASTTHSWADEYISNTLTVDGYMQDGDINTFAELQSWVSDEVLLKAGTLTDTKYCIYDSASGDIICNSEGGGSSFSSIAELNALMTGESVASTTHIWADSYISSASTWNAKWDELTDMTLAHQSIYVGDGSNNPVATSTITILDNGDVGIATATPAYTLDVYGNIRADGDVRTTGTFYGDTWSSITNNSMAIQPTGDTDDFFSFKTPADRPTIKREGGKFIYIESTNIYDAGISIRDGADYSGTFAFEKDTDRMSLSAKNSPLIIKLNSDYDDYFLLQTTSNTPEITVASSSALKINAGGTNSLLLNHAGGNVGIGTDSPLNNLDLAGSLRLRRIDGVLDPQLLFSSQDGTVILAQIEVSGSSKDIKFRTAGTDRLRILGSSGNVGIGTTSPLSTFSMNSGTNGFRIDSSGIVQQGSWQGTDVGVQYGGTGASSLTDGYILLGSGTGAITPLDLTAKGSLIVGDGTTDPIALTVGSDDKVLTASSTTSSGLAWETAAAGGGGDVGGLYGMNIETLTGAKTLTVDSNKIYQYLSDGGATRIITLATTTAIAGDRFIIKNTAANTYNVNLSIKEGASQIDKIYSKGVREYIFNGTNWKGVSLIDNSIQIGYGAYTYANGVAVGYNANAYNGGTAIGYGTNGGSSGVAVGQSANGSSSGTAIGNSANGSSNGAVIGNSANGSSYGAAVGYLADGASYGVALGYQSDTNQKKYSLALGYKSRLIRTSEIAHCIDGSYTQDYNMSSAGWAIQTANATPVEMFLGETANQRFTINPESVVSFTIRITARDNVANEVASYKIEGLIKRDGAGNTVLSWSSKTVEYEDDASWDIAVTADDTNEALIVTVTGDGTNPVRFAGRIDEVETQF